MSDTINTVKDNGSEAIYNKQNVWILTLGMFLMSAGYTMIVPFLPLYVRQLGASEHQVAIWAGSVYTITFLIAGIMAPIWGKYADRYGAKLMVMRSSLGIGLAYFIAGFVQTPEQLFAIRALQGFANGYLPAAMTLIAKSVPDSKVGTSLGVLQTGMIAGNILGPLMGGITAHVVGIRPVFYFVGILMMSVTMLIIKWVDSPVSLKKSATPKTSFVDDVKVAYGNKPLLRVLFIAFVVNAAVLMIQPVIAIYVGHLLGSPSHVGIVVGTILSIGGAIGAFMSNIWAGYGQRYGYYKIIFIGFIGAGTALLLQAFWENIWWFAILQITYTLFVVGFMPNVSAALSMTTPPEQRGRSFGVMSTCQQMGNIVGPMFASLFSTYLGIFYVFLVGGFVLLAMAFRVYKKHLQTL